MAKKLVKSNKSIFIFCEIGFLAVLNFFLVQKLIFGHFWNGKKLVLVENFFREIDYLISWFFLAWTFFFLSRCTSSLILWDLFDFSVTATFCLLAQKSKITYFIHLVYLVNVIFQYKWHNISKVTGYFSGTLPTSQKVFFWIIFRTKQQIFLLIHIMGELLPKVTKMPAFISPGWKFKPTKKTKKK